MFNMGIPIPGKDGLYIEMRPRIHWECQVSTMFICQFEVFPMVTQFPLTEIANGTKNSANKLSRRWYDEKTWNYQVSVSGKTNLYSKGKL